MKPCFHLYCFNEEKLIALLDLTLRLIPFIKSSEPKKYGAKTKAFHKES